jgi:uncharacterized membrane protein
MDTPPPPVTVPASEPVVGEDKTVAIISYLTIIGFIVAVVIHGNKKTKLGSYHLRQTLGLLVTAIALWALGFVLAFVPIVGWLVIFLCWVGLFVLWLLGFIAAANGRMTPVPVLGASYQKWFGNAFD